MTNTSSVAEPKAAPVDGGCRKAAIASHLTGPLRDYFALAEQAPMPPRLSVLVERIEAALAESGDRLAGSFRDDLLRSLPMLRTFAMSLCANDARADDLVQETLVRAWANRTRFTPGSNFTAWTFTILRNQFYSEIRKAKREVEDGDGAHAATAAGSPGPGACGHPRLGDESDRDLAAGPAPVPPPRGGGGLHLRGGGGPPRMPSRHRQEPGQPRKEPPRRQPGADCPVARRLSTRRPPLGRLTRPFKDERT